MDKTSTRQPLSGREKAALAVAGLVLLAVAAAAFLYMMTHRPHPQRRIPPRTAPQVQTVTLQPVEHRVSIPATGTVVPATEVDLKARVGGQVVWVSPELVEGGVVRQGQVLLKIDPDDYRLALTRKQAVLEKAVYDLKAEEGRQEVARSEWEILGLEAEATEQDRELALRRPQLAASQAALKAAEAEVRQAQLELERTVVKAPFNAVVRKVSVAVGAQASVQGTLAGLAGSDTFYVQAKVPVDRVGWLYLPDGNSGPASTADVVAGGRDRQARVIKLLGDVEPAGRLARLLLAVDDPLDLDLPADQRRPLLLGDYVSALIAGRNIRDVYRIPREHLKEGDLLWTVDGEDKLRIVPVEVSWREESEVFVRGVDPGTRLVVSDLPAAVEGMEVRVGSGDVKPRTPGTG